VWPAADEGSSSIDRVAAAIACGFDSAPDTDPVIASPVHASAMPAQASE
jgi:hypothetical protein